jgi:hypothetical protein
LIALRHVVRIDSMISPKARVPRRGWVRLLLPAAATVLALFGGYQWGIRRGAVAHDNPPAVTVVVPASGGWHQ